MTTRNLALLGAHGHAAPPHRSLVQTLRTLLSRAALAGTAAALLGACGDGHPLSPEAQLAKGAGGLGAPTNLTATTAWTTSIQLTWQDRSSNEDGFEVQRSATPTGTFTVVTTTSAGSTNHYDGELTPATQYCYKVRAVRRNGNKATYSEFSSTACATTFTATAPPSDVKAMPSFGYINISWSYSATVTGFRLERAASASGPWTQLYYLDPSYRSVYDWRAQTEQQSCYRVFASGQYGESAPSTAVCTVPPAAPTGLAASSPDQLTVDLSWTDNSAFEDGYEVQRSGDDGVWSVIASLPKDAVGYHDAGVSADAWYQYMVRAKKDGGFSPGSNYASIAIGNAPPPAPQYAVATPSSSTSATVYWYDPIRQVDGYRIERSTDGQQSWTPVGTATADQYSVEDYGLTSESEVCYRVIAFRGTNDASPVTDCTTPPRGPTIVSVIDIDEYTMEINWADNSAVEERYEVWYFSYEDAGVMAETGENGTSALVPRSYEGSWYAIVAIKDEGVSDWACCISGEGAMAAAETPSLDLLKQRVREKASLGAGRAPAPLRTRRLPR